MPLRVDLQPHRFYDFKTEIEKEGFQEIQKREKYTDYQRLALISPNESKGKKRGFKFTANYLTVKIWTSVLRDEDKFADKGFGWELISLGDPALYFSRPFRRTDNFFENLYMTALILKTKIQNRPICPHCKKFLDIVKGPYLYSRYWKCPNTKHAVYRLGWDHGLPDWAKNYLKSKRKARKKVQKKYAQKQLEKGKEVTPAIVRHKKWTIGNKDNIITVESGPH